MTVYIVTGWPRSGTSLAVQTIRDCGIEALVKPQQVQARGGYRHQPQDYFEPPSGWLLSAAKVRRSHGKVGKLLAPNVERLPAGERIDYRIVVMVRDPQEIIRSHHAAFGSISRFSPAEASRLVGRLSARPDVASVTVVDFRELVTDTGRAIARLIGDGWPLDPARAGEAVDETWWRHRVAP